MVNEIGILGAEVLRKVLSISRNKVNNKKVIFISYTGKQYSCSPKYIFQEMRKEMPEYECLWAFDEPDKFKFLEKYGVRLLKYNSKEFVKECRTAVYVITNVGISCWLPLSKEQLLINTWHGGGTYKRMGFSLDNMQWWEKKRVLMERKNPTVFLSSCKAASRMVIREGMQHKGEIIKSGMPRNDMLIKNNRSDLVKKVKEYLNIPLETKILLYAPTFRESKEVEDYAFEYKAVQRALEKRFGGNWKILFRAHYHVMKHLNICEKDVIDASLYPDMQELLYVTDVLVTDYSSSVWDFSFTGKPCLLYATDLEYYQKGRDFYMDIHEWPFPLAENGQELIYNIENFDNDKYKKAVELHHRQLGSYESGHAAEEICKYIKNRECLFRD